MLLSAKDAKDAKKAERAERAEKTKQANYAKNVLRRSCGEGLEAHPPVLSLSFASFASFADRCSFASGDGTLVIQNLHTDLNASHRPN